jgi:4-hydroxy-3-polyprenylbenzoate decarboxylase
MCLALGVEEPHEIATACAGLMQMEMPQGLWAKIMTALPKLKELSAFAPSGSSTRLPGGGA